MSRTLKVATLLGLMLFGFAAYPNFNLANAAKLEEVPFQTNHLQDDYSFGREFLILFNDLLKNKLESSEVQTLSILLKKSKSFEILNPGIERLKKIALINDQDSFYQNCEIQNLNLNEFTESILDRFNLTIDRYCRYLFINRVSNFSPYINLSSRDISFFKNATTFFVTGESQNELINLLKHFKQNIKEYETLSNLLIDKMIELKIRPSGQLLANVKMSTKLNQFLQNNLSLDDSSISFFQDEFQRSIKDAQEMIEKGDYTQGKQQTLGAISFYNRNKLYISDKRAFVGLIITAKAFYLKGQLKEATEFFEQARIIAPKEEFSESSFYLLWPSIIDKDYKGLKKAITKYNLAKDFDRFDSKLQYWIAISEMRTGDAKKGQEMLNKIISTSPYSFYSIISLKELALESKNKNTEEEILNKLIIKDKPLEIGFDKLSTDLKSSLIRFSVWNKLSNERFQTLEIRFIQTLKKENTFKTGFDITKMSDQEQKSFLTLNLVKLLNNKKRYITSFKIFQDSIEQNSLTLNYSLIKQIFPMSFFETIKKNSANLDPLIVISLIRQESAFNPEANSSVGAKGLMQLMPATAKQFNRKIKTHHLENPEINVAIGTKYLRQLLNRYEGNLIYALASYNAGENRIDRWRKDIFKTDDPLATIESIPFEETRNYVKLIYRNYFFYNLIHNKSILKTPLQDSFKISFNQK